VVRSGKFLDVRFGRHGYKIKMEKTSARPKLSGASGLGMKIKALVEHHRRHTLDIAELPGLDLLG